MKLYNLNEQTGQCYLISTVSYEENFSWTASFKVRINGIEVVDGLGNILWSLWGNNSVGELFPGDKLEINFDLAGP